MINRQLEALGVSPVLAYLLIVVGFVGLSVYLFHKTEFALYAYILLSLSLTSKLSNVGRNDFLRICFTAKRYRNLRILENQISSVPFLLFLGYKQMWLAAVFLGSLSVLLSLGRFTPILSFTIPTPFYKKPFEFTVGFRTNILVFIAAYILSLVSVGVGNFNLGVFSMLIVFVVAVSFYTKPENAYFVWIYALTARQFIWEKVKTSCVFTALLSLPIIFILGVFYSDKMVILVAFFAVGCIFLTTTILAKYAAFPNEMNLPEGMILALSISFPPLLLVFAPFFYVKAITKLERYLR
jgi:hypothetical protein